MKTGAIMSGGNIDTMFASEFLKKNKISPERIIAADRGLLCCSALGVVPAHIVGDFDSLGEARKEALPGMPQPALTAPELLAAYAEKENVTIHRYPAEKDWTDTELALDLALSLGWNKIWILGGTGSRLDHVMGCIRLLETALKRGAEAYMADPHNLIYLKDRSFAIQREAQWGKYVSFFPFGGPVEGLSLRGFRYPLEGVRLDSQPTLTVSNEIVGETGEVRFESGRLLVMETRD